MHTFTGQYKMKIGGWVQLGNADGRRNCRIVWYAMYDLTKVTQCRSGKNFGENNHYLFETFDHIIQKR